MIARLALMLFLQNAVNGVLVPMFSVRLHDMGFTPWQVAMCSATNGMIAMAAPLMGQVADRWVSPNRCLAACGVWCAAAMVAMAFAQSYGAMFLGALVYWLGAVPMSLMCSSIAFSLLDNPERDFGKVRVWGTIGWMTPAWVLLGWSALMGWDTHASMTPYLFLGAGLSLFLGAFALTLPVTKPRSQGVARVAPLEALRLIKGTTFACFVLAIFGWCLVHPFNVQGTPLLLKDLLTQAGGEKAAGWLPAVLTLGQINEVGTMLLFPLVIRAIGKRGSMILGLGAWLVTLLMLSAGKPLAMVVGSLLLNGLVITNFLMAGQVYLNGEVTGDLRASVQSLFFTVQGFGLMAGNLIFGALRDAIPEGEFESDLPAIFFIGAVITALIYGVFLLGFRPGKSVSAKADETETNPA
jgi:MFS family permease